MEEEVKIVDPKVAAKPLVNVQVEIIKIVVEQPEGCIVLSFHFLSFHKDFGDEIQNIEGVMLRG